MSSTRTVADVMPCFICGTVTNVKATKPVTYQGHESLGTKRVCEKCAKKNEKVLDFAKTRSDNRRLKMGRKRKV